MGILNSFFGIRANRSSGARSDEDVTSSDGETYPCDACGNEVLKEELASGRCEECDLDSDGTKYCCGAIYEEGEDTCASCGEML